MTPKRFLVSQILIVFAIVIAGLSVAMEWCAAELSFQPHLRTFWLMLLELRVYRPWQLVVWWFWYDAYAPPVFNEAGAIAAVSGLAGRARTIAGSLWRARQNRLVTTYGSSRWATGREVEEAGLFCPAGVFLGRLGGKYLRNDGAGACHGLRADEERHGLWPCHPDLAVLDRLSRHSRHQGGKLAVDRRLAGQVLALPAAQSDRSALRPLQTAAGGVQRNRTRSETSRTLPTNCSIPKAALGRRSHWEMTSHWLLVGAILHVLTPMKRRRWRASLPSSPMRRGASRTRCAG